MLQTVHDKNETISKTQGSRVIPFYDPRRLSSSSSFGVAHTILQCCRVLSWLGHFAVWIWPWENMMFEVLQWLKYWVSVSVWMLGSMLRALQGEIFACQFFSIPVVSTSGRGWQPSQVVADASSFFSSALKMMLTSLAGEFQECCMAVLCQQCQFFIIAAALVYYWQHICKVWWLHMVLISSDCFCCFLAEFVEDYLLHPRKLVDRVMLGFLVVVVLGYLASFLPMNSGTGVCIVTGDVAFCDDVCDVGASPKSVLFTGTVLNWTCVEEGWNLEVSSDFWTQVGHVVP